MKKMMKMKMKYDDTVDRKSEKKKQRNIHVKNQREEDRRFAA